MNLSKFLNARAILLFALLPLLLLASCAGPAGPRTKTTAVGGVTLGDFKLAGDLSDDRAAFTLNAVAKVSDAKGGSLDLLTGTVALTDVPPNAKWRVRVEQGKFVLVFDQAGEFPIQIKFNAAVRQNNGWNGVDFRLAPSTLQPITLRGLAEDTQFQFLGAARPERKGSEFVSYLPSDGTVRLAWKEARAEVEGKLFYAAEMLSQITVSPGLMRQVVLFEGKVMQGELTRVTLLLKGDGEITRVQGNQVLAWNVESLAKSKDRRLVVQFNQPQKDQFGIQIQMQTPLGAFPQAADAMQLRPEGATRFAGYYRIVNDGAVRLEVAQASGLSQISPEQFPETDATKNILRATGNQRFAYRFSGADYALRIQADQIQPELSVSELLAYHLGENEQAVDAEIELDIREAPLRELLLRVPKGYAIARITASGMSDYFLADAVAGETGLEGEQKIHAELRIVYGQPVTGRQVVQLRLERNTALSGAAWALPRVEVVKAKSTRGHVAVSADAGFRLTAERTQALTDIATAFFPRKVAGIQAAFRLSDPAWEATMRVERLPQTVVADAFHLFSIGEGIAYGSSVMNYVVSGAPLAAFRVELSDEYSNVEFTGKDVRTWQKMTNGFLVQLHSPVAGQFTLLATYERKFKPQGDTLAFTGARPLDVQSEAGHTLVISAYQFQVKPEDVSPGLLPLETGEVPPEYRLFFDAPILAAYRYTSRPFNLKLALSPLAQGASLNQVVDRASIRSRVSKAGQVLTDVSYLVKSRGNANFRMTLPPGTDLWSATVNGASVVPVKDGAANLIPLPQRADPNAVLKLDLVLAAKSASASRVTIGAPVVGAPVMLAEWKLEPDAGQRLVYRRGSLTPMEGAADNSGFVQMMRLFRGRNSSPAFTLTASILVLVLAALVVWRWAGHAGVSRMSMRHLFGTVLGAVAIAFAVIAGIQLTNVAGRERAAAPENVTFIAPVQQPNSALTVEVGNVPAQTAELMGARIWLPVVLAVLVWAFTWLRADEPSKPFLRALAWTLLAWAALRYPNGAPLFFAVFGAYLLVQIVFPALRRLILTPRATPVDSAGAAPAVAALILLATVTFASAQKQPTTPPPAATAPPVATPSTASAIADSVKHEICVEEKYVLGRAKIRWNAEKDQVLPLLYEPAVLTKVTFPNKALRLETGAAGARLARRLVAEQAGAYDIEVQYQSPVTKNDTESGFQLPTQAGLINELSLTLINLDVDVFSAQAVSVQRDSTGSNTVAQLVLAPGDAWIGWRPRSRDLKREKPVFHAELHQLYVPSAGVIEGAHYATIRPARGELSELIFVVPNGATVTDVYDPAGANPALVSLWRFDPDTRKLRVNLNRPQSRPFALVVRSQVATGPLPFEQPVGLVAVENAASQIGLLGVATGNEVQLDNVDAGSLSPINLEDFPSAVSQSLAPQIPGLTVRRAFRYGEARGTATVKASPVESDVRVESQDTLSLGEDRTVLASTATVDITRAGIFRLSFALPAGMDVESISGAALSHWTEAKSAAGRIITLQLRGKTLGKQEFTISLTGPGVKASKSWTVPQLVLREAGKQRGTLVVVPEQGMRLQVATRDGIMQLDPKKSGIRQKGVLAFRVLQSPWSLSLALEQVDPMIQVTSLQHASINEAQAKVTANLQYQIENTGLKAFRVYLPANAESVHFQGEQVADFLKVPGAVTNEMQLWEVKLQRRIIGQHLLQATYQTLIGEKATETVLRGVQADDVNLQRGFVTVQASGRLQVRAETVPAELQPTEWQSIPRVLQQDLQTATANFAFRLVEPAFQLALKLDRHEAAKLLPARVNNVTFTSVIADDGNMLTQVRLEMLPGDKRLLALTLPPNATFWFAFVNQNGVWPWRDKDKFLIPLEQQSRAGKPTPVEIFYSSSIGKSSGGDLDLALLAPKFDLPLEDIQWRVHLNPKWHVKKWTGTLQLQNEEVRALPAVLDLNGYLQTEAAIQREKTMEAEQMLALGNTALERGDPQQARRAFQAAYGLSTHDYAFNEDARVQLHNLKLQQALVGLNVRSAAAAGENDALSGKFRELREGKTGNYTQQDAKQINDRNSADDNSAYLRLAEKLIQQQDAAVASPTAIRANIPEQGRVLTFQRAVAVDQEADLRIGLEAATVKTASSGMRGVMLFLTLAVLAAMGLAARALGKPV